MNTMKEGRFAVIYPHVGEIIVERVATLTEAADLALALYQSGAHPSIEGDGVKAGPMCANKWAARPMLEWWLSFASNDGYKSVACHQAEDAGIRYRSHRAGYRASIKAMRRFAAQWDELTATHAHLRRYRYQERIAA